jgi:metallo-beta-lactamase class B
MLLSAFLLGLFIASHAQTSDDRAAWNKPVEPFRIAGNIYYVGAADVTSYLITTPKGHILIDSGLPETVPQIIKNVTALGFKPGDIKIILNSHAHFDHAGGIAALKKLTRARFYASRKDAPLLEAGGLGDPNYGDRFPFEAVKPDKLLMDTQKVRLGGSTLTANVTAGHTPGCTTWTTTVKEKDRSLNVMFLCSVSSPGYNLVTNKAYPTIEADFRASFAWLKQAQVDVFLAAHGSIFDLAGKARALRSGAATNPFIDAKGYRDFIEQSEKVFLDKLASQRAAH